jgi:hypothetical protein
MKIIWEPDDIRPGRRVGREGRSEQWIIGYDSTVTARENVRYTIISLADGMVFPFRTKEDLCVLLNNSGDVPVNHFRGDKT